MSPLIKKWMFIVMRTSQLGTQTSSRGVTRVSDITVRKAASPSPAPEQSTNHSECCKRPGKWTNMCLYMIGSSATLFSVGAMFVAVNRAENNSANMAVTALMSLSYFLKLPYYHDKQLAFVVNFVLGFLWGCAFIFSCIKK